MNLVRYGLSLTLALGTAGSLAAEPQAPKPAAAGKHMTLRGTVVRVHRELGYVVVEDQSGQEHGIHLRQSRLRPRNWAASPTEARVGDAVIVPLNVPAMRATGSNNTGRL